MENEKRNKWMRGLQEIKERMRACAGRPACRGCAHESEACSTVSVLLTAIECIEQIQQYAEIGDAPAAGWTDECRCPKCGAEAANVKWHEEKKEFDEAWGGYVKVADITRVHYIRTPFCPYCGVRVDGDNVSYLTDQK